MTPEERAKPRRYRQVDDWNYGVWYWDGTTSWFVYPDGTVIPSHFTPEKMATISDRYVEWHPHPLLDVEEGL